MAISTGSPRRIHSIASAGELGLARIHPPGRGLAGEDQPVGRAVVHDQQPLAGEQRRVVGRLGPGRDGSRVRFQLDVEGRTRTKRALRPDRAVHELDQPAADGKTEAGPAVAAGRRGVDLAERGEQSIHPVGRDPDARVAHRQVDSVPSRARLRRLGVHGQDDLAPFGELDGVVSRLIRIWRRRAGSPTTHVGDAGLDAYAELEPLLLPRSPRPGRARRSMHAPQVERTASRAPACRPRSSRSRGCR